MSPPCPNSRWGRSETKEAGQACWVRRGSVPDRSGRGGPARRCNQEFVWRTQLARRIVHASGLSTSVVAIDFRSPSGIAEIRFCKPIDERGRRIIRDEVPGEFRRYMSRRRRMAHQIVENRESPCAIGLNVRPAQHVLRAGFVKVGDKAALPGGSDPPIAADEAPAGDDARKGRDICLAVAAVDAERM